MTHWLVNHQGLTDGLIDWLTCGDSLTGLLIQRLTDWLTMSCGDSLTGLHLHLSRSQWPLGHHGCHNPLPPFYFVFSFSYGVAKLQLSLFSDFFLPTLSFVAPFFSLLALFLVKSSWQALMILIHAQTPLTCVSLLRLRYHHRAQWLAWFCLWLHR